MKNFKITCEKCGSENVEIKLDSDYVYNGEYEVLELNGDIELYCKFCGNYEII